MGERFYEIGKRGLATNFAESEIPLDYAVRFRNRFINAAGAAEKRPGYVALAGSLPTKGTVTGLHEYTDSVGEETLFASADGKIFRYDGSTWTQVYAFTTAARIKSIQFSNRMVFYNGYDRQVNIISATGAFSELQALMEQGICGTATSAKGMNDSDIADWTAQTFVTEGDIVFNAKRGSYAVVTAVTSGNITHTAMSAAAQGFGSTLTTVSGAGPGGDPTTGDAYKIFDSVELNVIDNDGVPDNVGTVLSSTETVSGTYVTVSSDRVMNWLKTEIRDGDIFYNTTKAAASFVHTILSSGIYLQPSITTTSAGDAFILYKSAMPIASVMHIHFGRAWIVDARNRRLITASGPDDIEDFSVDPTTVTTNSLDMGSQQDGGDIVRALATFQNYLVVGTEHAVYAYRGIDPEDLTPAGLFPQGIVGPSGFVNTGNDLAYVAYDGLMSVSLLMNTNNLQRSNLSEPIKNTLRTIIRSVVNANPEDPDIQVLNYQRRSWVVLKIASKLYIYNYSSFLAADGRLLAGAAWSDFDGQIGLQRSLEVRNNSDLILGGADGMVYTFDQGTYTDAGTTYTTDYTTGWLTLEEPRRTTRSKMGTYIIPQFQVGGDVVYTIEATGDYDMLSLDSVQVTAREDIGGRPIGVFTIGGAIGTAQTLGQKTPLRWRGSSFRISFRTQDTYGPDILAGFYVYAEMTGRR